MKTLYINEKALTYHIERKRVKNINMRMKSDGIVYVSANASVSVRYIEELLAKKCDYFLSAQERISNQQKKKSDINAMRYLGRKYPIEVNPCSEESTELIDESFVIGTCGAELTESEILYRIKRWQVERCKELYREINERVYKDFLGHGYKVSQARVNIKEMKTRWGSCNVRDNKLSMNLRLIEYPESCIYSVFYHEYMHFIHHDHSSAFHADLNKIYPPYKECSRILKGETE